MSNILATEWAVEPGHDDQSWRDATRALAKVFGHDQWNGLTLLQQCAVLADFLPITADRVYMAAIDAANQYVSDIGQPNLRAYANTMLVNLERASQVAVIRNQAPLSDSRKMIDFLALWGPVNEAALAKHCGTNWRATWDALLSEGRVRFAPTAKDKCCYQPAPRKFGQTIVSNTETR